MPRQRPETAAPSPPPEGWQVLSADAPNAYPLAVVFDLDYTIWDLWIDTHITPPLKRKGDELNHLTDRCGTALSLFPEVPALLAELKVRRIHIAAASRTHTPELAREALSLLLVAGADGTVRAQTYFNTMEIYPGSKLRHFREIHRATGIPYEQMLFFDDEHRNFEVERLGVTMVLVRDGMDWAAWREGVNKWRGRRGIKVGRDGRD
ncbi:hypothetical protein CspeluHIS016_0404760 [Cutaneotrichosporon spelunceum]|uniref:Magnesium-dependent phosphatase-1 n=1 Tax=Cutaneotrichosporon spelunceum TaxID=1672016 RepID=A0AAD3TWC8_9TREE|nr:hypothetical protein CspeluHIS016_0404760 [Cutaneotrichosporon spelunceum]